MEPIIAPVDRNIIETELTVDKYVRDTNNGGNKLYVVTYEDSPNTMNEIGRLRELSFRTAGGGTGKNLDIDEFDIQKNPYKQLIVWNPRDREIVGGYRYILCESNNIDELATAELFIFTQKFIDEYMPKTIELGRSFVQPKYQNNIYALDNLWDGLGALVVKYPEINYFFGKVTMYVSYNIAARNLLLYFLRKYFHDNEELVLPIHPLLTYARRDEMEQIFTGKNYKEDYKNLTRKIRENGEHIPPLINSYMKLSPSMKIFGTALNPGFGGVEETGILIKISDIYSEKLERYIGPLRKLRRRIKWFRRR
ncbi:MAG: GNAT family N-acetyltransferase [Prevotellaceae bacterium]|jgi:hypothetical protein|nr:GNAT family N-acetyltransferase [Prevotellaceae bacterium]